jgi:hypothetical protein
MEVVLASKKKPATAPKKRRSARKATTESDRVRSFKEAVAAIHSAAVAAGVETPMNEAEISEYIRKQLRISSEESARGAHEAWWSMRIRDATVPGMYLVVRVEPESVGMWAGVGDGRGLRAFAEACDPRDFEAALRELAAQFGKPSWQGRLRRDLVQ